MVRYFCTLLSLGRSDKISTTGLNQLSSVMTNYPDRSTYSPLKQQQKPPNPVVEEIYGCVENGDILGAIDRLDRAIHMQPNCAHYYAERANFYAQIGNIQQAIADYDSAVAIQPDNQLFQHWRSQLIE
jgi:tetratricopeptide (TPR) repeat protein